MQISHTFKIKINKIITEYIIKTSKIIKTHISDEKKTEKNKIIKSAVINDSCYYIVLL